MIGVIKERIVHKLGGKPEHMWWNNVDDVVKEYNSENVSRSTKMTPNEAAKPENQQDAKTNLESIRRSENPQPVINIGDEVRVMKKNKFDKSYVPEWTEETYKVNEKKEWNHVYMHDDNPKDPQKCMGSATPPMTSQATSNVSCVMNYYLLERKVLKHKMFSKIYNHGQGVGIDVKS